MCEYPNEMIPEENSSILRSREDSGFEMELDPEASHIDFFSNHRKTIRHGSVSYATYISSPYTRVELPR